MDASTYLQSYGWKKGEPLKRGGLKRPLLVKHKKDQKGLGHNHDNQEAWWERVFDGQLKGLDINVNSKNVSFNQREIKPSGMSRHLSPLYKNFVSGGVLAGTIEDSKLKKSKGVDEVVEVTSVLSKKKRKRESKKHVDKAEVDKIGKVSKERKKNRKLKKKKESLHLSKEKKLKSDIATAKQSSDDWIRSLVKQMEAEKVAA